MLMIFKKRILLNWFYDYIVYIFFFLPGDDPLIVEVDADMISIGPISEIDMVRKYVMFRNFLNLLI